MDPVSTAGAREDAASVSDLLAEFAGWLDRQRGLAPVTIHNYCWHAGQFLAALPEPAQLSVSLLDAGTVTAFMVGPNSGAVEKCAAAHRACLAVPAAPACPGRVEPGPAGT